MRRVFPVRPADNGSFADAKSLRRRTLEHAEDPVKRNEEQRRSFDSSQKVRKIPSSYDSTNISGDENLNNINNGEVVVSRPPSHQKPPRASAYPIFTAGASHRYSNSVSGVSGKLKLSGEKQCTASLPSNLPLDSQIVSLKETFTTKPRSEAEKLIRSSKNSLISDTGSQKYSLRSLSFRYTQLPDSVTRNGTDEALYHDYSDCRPSPFLSHSRSLSLSTSEAAFSESSDSTSCGTKGMESSESLTSKKNSAGGRAGRGSSQFKYLSARVVAEKLVKVLGKEKSKSEPNMPISSKLPQTMMEESSCASSKELTVHSEKKMATQDLCFKQPSLESPRETDDNASEYSSIAASRIDGSSDGNIKQSSSCNTEPNFQRSLEARAVAREELAFSLDKESNLFDAKYKSRTSDNFAAETSMWDINRCKQEIRKLQKDKKNLALEVAHEIRARISEQNVAADRLKDMKMETELKLLAIMKKKDMFQETLEKELEQRGNEWTAQLKKMKSEEQKLQEKIRELSADKSELQKVVSSFKQKEAAWREENSSFKQKEAAWREESTQLETLLSSLKERLASSEAEMARQMQAYTTTLEKVSASDIEFATISQQCELSQRENLELQNELIRLRRVCKDQEMTIEGLCQELDETVNNSFDCRTESLLRLQRELLRLAGVEQGLRSEINAMHAELKLNQEKNSACMDTPADFVKLNQELQERIDKIQSETVNLQEENEKLTLSLRATVRAQRDLEKTIKLYQLKEVTGAVVDLSLSEKTAGTVDFKLERCEGVTFSEHVVLVERNLRDLNSKLQLKDAELKRLNEEFLEILHARESLQMEVDDLHRKLLVTNQQNRDLELQIDRKEVVIEVLEADGDKLNKELTNLQSDLACIRRQRDEMQKDAENKSREVLRLSMALNESKKAAEKLEEELMFKEGQISILRGTYATSDNVA